MLIDNLLFVGGLSYASVNSKPFVVPNSNNGQEKMVISPGNKCEDSMHSANPELLRIAQMFAERLSANVRKNIKRNSRQKHTRDFILSLSADKSGRRGYEIKITDRITTSAPTPDGALLEHTYPLANSRNGALIS